MNTHDTTHTQLSDPTAARHEVPHPRTAPHPDEPRAQHPPDAPILGRITDEPPAPAPTLRELALIATDAAHRAARLLAGAAPTDPDPLVDLIRLLDTEGAELHLAAATQRADLTPHEMGRLRRAHRYGGEAAVRTTLYSTDPDPVLLEQAAADISQLRTSPTTLEIHRNRITDHAAGVQIRLGPDQRWYPYASERENWAPARHPDPSPAAAYTAALHARRARSRV